MLTVSENTYITIAEADELISTHLDKYNGLKLFWEILDELTEGRAHTLRAELRQFRTSF